MKPPKKLSIIRKTLVASSAKQPKPQVQGIEVRTTSICPFICW